MSDRSEGISLEATPVEADHASDAASAATREATGARPPLWITLSFAAVALHGIDAWVIRPGRDRGLLVRGLTLAVIGTVWAQLVSLWRRSGARRQGAVAAALGAAAVIAGVGITVFNIREFGLDGHNLAGLISIVAGAVLLTAGTAIIVRSFRSRWRWPLALGTAALLVVYVLTPVTVAVYTTKLPRAALGPTTPADHGLAYEDVTFTTVDGVRLSGWYVPGTNRAAVILLHGSGEARNVMLAHAETLSRHGYAALLMDARGHGESEGAAMEWGWHGAEDLDAAVTYLVSRPDVDPDRIAALGLSMGAHSALTAAAEDPRIAAVVAEGASARSFDDVVALARPLALPGWWLQFTVADWLSAASPPMPLEDAMGRIAPRPVLLIAGDEPRELRANEMYRAAGGPTTSLWRAAEAAHARAVTADPHEYERRVVAFLDRALALG